MLIRNIFPLRKFLTIIKMIDLKSPLGVTESKASSFSKIALSVLWRVFKMMTALDFRSTNVITAPWWFLPWIVSASRCPNSLW